MGRLWNENGIKMGAGEATKTLCMWAVTVFSFHLPWRLPAELLIRYGIVWGGSGS